jgi:hypothetical protein
MNQNSRAVTIALAHIDAWSHHDWDKTKEMLAATIHALVTSTQPRFSGSEITGTEKYMELKMKAAQLIEPGSVQVLSTIGDDMNALITISFRIGLGTDGTMVTMARSCLYLIDENNKINDERDVFFVVSH